VSGNYTYTGVDRETSCSVDSDRRQSQTLLVLQLQHSYSTTQLTQYLLVCSNPAATQHKDVSLIRTIHTLGFHPIVPFAGINPGWAGLRWHTFANYCGSTLTDGAPF